MLQLLQVKHILLQSSDHPADPIPGPFVRVTHLLEGPMLFFFIVIPVCVQHSQAQNQRGIGVLILSNHTRTDSARLPSFKLLLPISLDLCKRSKMHFVLVSSLLTRQITGDPSH